MEHWGNAATSMQQDDFFVLKNSVPQNMSTQIVPSIPQPSYDTESLQQLKAGFTKMMSMMERLEQRINRVEQTTNQILKNQQEVLSAPFISQTELENARKAAEQLEHDNNVAKQLQAAYNKEVEVKKNLPSQNSYSSMMMLADCPICGARVNQMELEGHVNKCLEQFSNDPKKETQVKETQKKMETGFFGRLGLMKGAKVKTETKVVSTSHTSTTPLLSHHHPEEMAHHGMYPPTAAYSYPAYPSNGQMPQMGHPMMMPMYMPYPTYPQHMGGSTNE